MGRVPTEPGSQGSAPQPPTASSPAGADPSRGARAAIPCRHCAIEYVGTWRQLKRLRQEGRGGYCSDICKRAAIEKRRKKPQTFGPCPTCSQMFESKAPKTYCSMKCYTSSERFAAVQNMASKRALEAQGLTSGRLVPCRECGAEVYAKPSQKRRYCSSQCYRSYLAKRFDRWIASPSGISIDQSYDEFLTQEELECPIEGCDWHGQSLSYHMNIEHGVPAREFKRAAGFNLTTGVIAAPLREAFCARSGYGSPNIARFAGKTERSRGYVSKEGQEHRAKARVLLEAEFNPISKNCPQCGTSFQQRSVGHKTYCSVDCRGAALAARRAHSRDSDGSGEAGETPKSGSTEGDSAGAKHIANPSPAPSKDHP